MLRTTASLLAIILLLAVRPVGAAEEGPSIQGAWTVISAEKNGAPYNKAVGDKFTFAGDKLTIQPNASQRSGEEATFTLGMATRPNTIDLKPLRAEKPLLGICEIKGDRMKFCFREKEGPRPTDFASTPDSGIHVLTLERQKPQLGLKTDRRPGEPAVVSKAGGANSMLCHSAAL